MAISTSRLLIKQDLLRRLMQLDENLRGLPVPLPTTALGTSTTLVAARARLGTGNANMFDGPPVRAIEIVEAVGGGPALGEVAFVTDGGFAPITGTLTVAPAYTAAVQTSTDVLVYPLGLIPETVHEAISRILRATTTQTLWAPTLVRDGDFDANDITNWPAILTPTTRAFSTTVANNLLGERSLRIVTDAVDEGAESGSFYVTEGEPLRVYANTQTITGSCKVILRRVTATAVDVRTVEVDEPAWTEVAFNEPVPGDMEEGSIRFLSGTASSEFFISPPVIVQSGWRHRYLAPTWLVREGQVLGAMYLPQGSASEDAYSYIALAQPWEHVPGLRLLRDDRAVNPMWLEFANVESRPLFILASRPYADLTTDAATTTLSREYLVAKACALLLKDLGDERWRQFAREANDVPGVGEDSISFVKEYIQIA